MKKDDKLEFSVLMSCYRNDDPDLLRSAFLSIQNNTALPVSVVLVVDGPIPQSLEVIISEFGNLLPLDIQRLTENLGLARALNHGLTFIQTEFCIRADADDVNLPDRFILILETLAAGYDLVGSFIDEYDPNNNHYVATKEVPLDQRSIMMYARKRNPFNHMSVGFRTNVVKRAGGYPNILLREDYALWVTLLANNLTCCNIPKVLVHASAGEGMYKRRGGRSHIAAEFTMQSLLTRLGFKGFFAASFDFILKSVIYLLPSIMRKQIYLYALRK